MQGPAAMVLSALMLGGFLLGGGAIWLLARGGNAKRAWLMLVAALVMFGNVAIWTLPLG